MRKAKQESLRTETAQFNTATQYKDSVLEDPVYWYGHCKQAVASTIMQVTYGTSPPKWKYKDNVTKFHDFVDRVTRTAMPGAHYVEVAPWLRYLPRCIISPWKRMAGSFFAKHSEIFKGIYENTRTSLSQGTQSLSLTRAFIEDGAKYGPHSGGGLLACCRGVVRFPPQPLFLPPVEYKLIYSLLAPEAKPHSASSHGG